MTKSVASVIAKLLNYSLVGPIPLARGAARKGGGQGPAGISVCSRYPDELVCTVKFSFA